MYACEYNLKAGSKDIFGANIFKKLIFSANFAKNLSYNLIIRLIY